MAPFIPLYYFVFCHKSGEDKKFKMMSLDIYSLTSTASICNFGQPLRLSNENKSLKWPMH